MSTFNLNPWTGNNFLTLPQAEDPHETPCKVILISVPVDRASNPGVVSNLIVLAEAQDAPVIFQRVHNAVVLFAHTKILERRRSTESSDCIGENCEGELVP